jgi:hypothetical protein
MEPESDSNVEEADSLLLGRGMKLMARERGNGLGVAFGSRLPFSLGDGPDTVLSSLGTLVVVVVIAWVKKWANDKEMGSTDSPTAILPTRLFVE